MRKGKAAKASANAAPQQPASAPARDVPVWTIALVLAIPLVLVLGYGSLISPPGSLFTPGAVATAPASGPANAPGASAGGATDATLPPDIEQMVERLAKRLETQPDDANGWSTLARTYYALKRFPEAVAAYERLVKIGQPDANTLADYADALAMTQGRNLSGKPIELVRDALKADPSHWKALSMAGTEAFSRSDYRAALDYWQRARAVVEPGSDNARMLDANIAEARQRADGAR